jgi:C4-dicarboxylate-binding protein DctP
MTLRLAIAASFLLVTEPRAAQPTVITFSHVVGADTPKGRAAEFFARRAEELTRGQVRVEVHANGALHRDAQEIEALQLGAVQMLAPPLSKLAALGATEFEVFDLPFLFADEAELRAVTEGPVGRRLLGTLGSKGIRGLAFWDHGFKAFSANTPLRAPEDFRGLTMRVHSSMVLQAQMRALGAVPQVVSSSDAQPPLVAGAVDGTENSPTNLYTQQLHETQKHVALTRHGYLGYAVIVNERFWDGLAPGVRRRLEQALRESTAFANRLAKEMNEQHLAQVVAAGTTEVHAPTPAERLALKRALASVHQEMEERLGRQLLRSVHAATSFDPDAL